MTERRAKGKLVTVIAGLDPEANDLNELGGRLKNACGAGGTVKEGRIELQGDHLGAAETALQAIGYLTRAVQPRAVKESIQDNKLKIQYGC